MRKQSKTIIKETAFKV